MARGARAATLALGILLATTARAGADVCVSASARFLNLTPEPGFVRAMQPWPTAYTFLHRPGKEPMRVIVSEAHEFPVRFDPDAAPGQFINEPRFPKSVLCVSGHINPEERSVLEISQLQPAGKKKMTAEEFLRGYPIVEGMRFGPEVLA